MAGSAIDAASVARPEIGCPAISGGGTLFTTCDLASGHDGEHRGVRHDGLVWRWRGMSELYGCVADLDAATMSTGHPEEPHALDR